MLENSCWFFACMQNVISLALRLGDIKALPVSLKSGDAPQSQNAHMDQVRRQRPSASTGQGRSTNALSLDTYKTVTCYCHRYSYSLSFLDIQIAWIALVKDLWSVCYLLATVATFRRTWWTHSFPRYFNSLLFSARLCTRFWNRAICAYSATRALVTLFSLSRRCSLDFRSGLGGGHSSSYTTTLTCVYTDLTQSHCRTATCLGKFHWRRS